MVKSGRIEPLQETELYTTRRYKDERKTSSEIGWFDSMEQDTSGGSRSEEPEEDCSSQVFTNLMSRDNSTENETVSLTSSGHFLNC